MFPYLNRIKNTCFNELSYSFFSNADANVILFFIPASPCQSFFNLFLSLLFNSHFIKALDLKLFFVFFSFFFLLPVFD